MRRLDFLIALLAVPALGPAFARSAALDPGDEYDPATSASAQSLRVLLPAGTAVANAGGFTLDGRPYRGTFSRMPDGSIVNTLTLEEYLYSVVPREMPSGWPSEALQAQAICARTYVLARSQPRRAYDVVPSELDQVYDGVASETPAGRAAVDATASRVVRFGAGFAQMMYSSCCGGRTEASSEAWGGTPFPYLGGVECRYCVDSPHYRWQRSLERSAVESAFAREIEPFGSLQNVRVDDRDPSGRVRSIELLAERGSTSVRGAAFRARVGSRVLPSLLIMKAGESAATPGAWMLEGGGLGHGVGMCQWGARGFAARGASARDILALYFPGTGIA